MLHNNKKGPHLPPSYISYRCANVCQYAAQNWKQDNWSSWWCGGHRLQPIHPKYGRLQDRLQLGCRWYLGLNKWKQRHPSIFLMGTINPGLFLETYNIAPFHDQKWLFDPLFLATYWLTNVGDSPNHRIRQRLSVSIADFPTHCYGNRWLPDSPRGELADSPSHQYGGSATPRLINYKYLSANWKSESEWIESTVCVPMPNRFIQKNQRKKTGSSPWPLKGLVSR